MLIALVIAYLAIVVSIMLAQRRMIFFPTRLSADQAEQIATASGYQPWHDGTGQCIGWKIPTARPPAGTALILHGNSGCALNRDYLAHPLHEALNLNVFTLEYPGYGVRNGTPSKDSLLAAAEAAFVQLDHNKPIYVVSESLGTGVATHLAKTHPDEIAGLLLFTPYDDLAAVAQTKMPLIPVYLIMRERFRPAEWLKHYHGPVQFVLAGADEVIQPKFGQRLYDKYDGPKALMVLPDAAHNEIDGQPLEWWREVFKFWERHQTKPIAPPLTPE